MDISEFLFCAHNFDFYINCTKSSMGQVTLIFVITSRDIIQFLYCGWMSVLSHSVVFSPQSYCDIRVFSVTVTRSPLTTLPAFTLLAFCLLGRL